MGKKIVFCHCQGKIIESSRLETIEKHLSQSGIPFTTLKDLCGICASKKDEANLIFQPQDEIMMLACYPRSVKMLLEHAGIALESGQLSIINLRESSGVEIENAINSFVKETPDLLKSEHFESGREWPAWYPVIDYSRCTSCGQCSDFCLFGVYEKIDGKVTVVNPKGCKNNCPACARICPQTAIVFPKYEQGGAIAGSEQIDEKAEHQRQLHDMDSILGSDIYKALELRKTKRQSIIKNEAMNQALEEREKALKDKFKS